MWKKALRWKGPTLEHDTFNLRAPEGCKRLQSLRNQKELARFGESMP